MQHTIRYYADNSSMGDTPPSACDQYRAWAYATLVAAYPDHYVEIWDTPSLVTASTSDEDNRDDIIEYCARLWDACPWDWIV